MAVSDTSPHTSTTIATQRWLFCGIMELLLFQLPSSSNINLILGTVSYVVSDKLTLYLLNQLFHHPVVIIRL
jgi:hypothetical protein